MNHHQAQEKFVETVNTLASKVECYFWKLTGGEPNSLCRFLGMKEEDLKSVLRLCGVLGKNDNISKNKFDFFETRLQTEHNIFKKQLFIKLGKGGDATLPKDNYGTDGVLLARGYPVPEKHFFKVSISQKGNIPSLLRLATAAENKPAATKEQPKKVTETLPRDIIVAFFQELVENAANSGKGSISAYDKRRFMRLFNAAVSEEAKMMLQSAMKEMEHLVDDKAATPDRIQSEAPVVTPQEPKDLTADIQVEAKEDQVDTSADEFLAELQEEIALQSLLHKRLHDKNERVFNLEHRNGKKLQVVLPIDSKSATSFVEEGRRSGWIDSILETEEKKKGMALCLAKTAPDLYRSVAKEQKTSTGLALTAAQTIALARVGNLNDVRLKKVKAFLRKVGEVAIKHSTKECNLINEEVGVKHANKDIKCGSQLFEWRRNKGKEKKEPEQVHYWNAELSNEAEAEIDLHLGDHFQENPEQSSIPELSYTGDSFEEKGVTILIGGDHGDKNCPVSAKSHLSSPDVRKARGELNYKCPMIQFASVQCTKDSYEMLQTTVMPAIKQQLIHLKKSGIVTVYNKKDTTKTFKSFMVPRNIKENTIAFTPNKHMTYAYGDNNNLSHGTIDLNPYFDESVPFFDLAAKVVIHRFNELFIGDLAFLAMLIGMTNSDGDWCLLCQSIASQFNTAQGIEQAIRTKESLVQCLENYTLEKRNCTTKSPPKNHLGVNSEGSLDVDPERIIVPVLHCPMGLVDKLWETFKAWINPYVEKLDDNQDNTRTLYRLAKETHTARDKVYRSAKKLSKENPDDKEAKKLMKEAYKQRAKANKELMKVKEPYVDVMKKHNAKKSSLAQRFEAVFRSNGVKREHCHGGKFNGVNCIRIMAKATSMFEGFLKECLTSRTDSMTEEKLRTTINKCTNLFGTLDVIWSNARGIECGLLPTPEQKQRLGTAVASGKRQWLELDVGTKQPKWHLTFDGHLVEQVSKFGGLADKADDSIEKFHQVLKDLRNRFRSISSYERRENCIRRELRRMRSPKIRKELDRFEELNKDKSKKRNATNQQKLENKREAKRARREAVVLE